MIQRAYAYNLFLILALFLLPAFTVEDSAVAVVKDAVSQQPADERAAQESLPMAKDAIWDVLYTTKVKFDNATSSYSAVFPEPVKQLAGTVVTISGFMLPLESTEKFTHFLLSKRTPTCYFCPPGDPNEIVEVFATKPIEWSEDLVTYTGTFALTNDKEAGIFFKMSQAKEK